MDPDLQLAAQLLFELLAETDSESQQAAELPSEAAAEVDPESQLAAQLLPELLAETGSESQVAAVLPSWLPSELPIELSAQTNPELQAAAELPLALAAELRSEQMPGQAHGLVLCWACDLWPALRLAAPHLHPFLGPAPAALQVGSELALGPMVASHLSLACQLAAVLAAEHGPEQRPEQSSCDGQAAGLDLQRHTQQVEGYPSCHEPSPAA